MTPKKETPIQILARGGKLRHEVWGSGRWIEVREDGLMYGQDGEETINWNVCIYPKQWHEYKEPKEIVFWKNEYPAYFSNDHETREQADHNAIRGRIGRHKVTLTSGAWDE